jgi:hypothetical protein
MIRESEISHGCRVAIYAMQIIPIYMYEAIIVKVLYRDL